MEPNIACLVGEEAYRQWDAGLLTGQKLGVRATPFGPSGETFLVTNQASPFYLMARHMPARGKVAPHRINYRANMYALRDLGIRNVLAWGPGGAIMHTLVVGDMVILDDLIDQTYLRPNTFFDDLPLGYLRQFPVFCPALRRAASAAMAEHRQPYHSDGTAAVREGPRLETPAEVRMLMAVGAGMVTHAFAPEAFLAKELEMCYSAVCYVVNYAEMGSRHRPFMGGELFGGLVAKSDADRIAGSLAAMPKITASVAAAMENAPPCECRRSLAHFRKVFNLPDDWRNLLGLRNK